MVKEKIESVFPLTHMQSALLFHKLQAVEDQGFLQVSCSLDGPLDEGLFKQAWKEACQRHEVMRTSIHWEEISQPVQVVQEYRGLNWVSQDWRGGDSSVSERFQRFKEEDVLQELPLTQAPVSRFNLIRWSEESYYFLWSFHHILLDGWSSMIILEEVMEIYAALREDRSINLPEIPAYRDLLSWQYQQDKEAEKSFWEKWLAGFETPNLIGKGNTTEEELNPLFETYRLDLPQSLSDSLKDRAGAEGISLPVFLQLIWSLILAKAFSQNEVVYGLTVGGRSHNFPGIEKMSQAMMNLVPVRINLPDSGRWKDVLKSLQRNFAQLSQFESTPLPNIQSWMNGLSGNALFDILVVFQGFPWESIEKGKLRLYEVVGKTTSVYPLTLMIHTREQIGFTFRYNKKVVDNAFVEWAAGELMRMSKILTQDEMESIGELFAQLNAPPQIIQPTENRENHQGKQIELAATSHEILLTQIWEKILGRKGISAIDNFFEIGGSSILAVQIFAEIREQVGLKLAPSSLLTHPTIRSLAPLLGKESQEHWASLVSLQPKGSRPPLFFIHDIGGDIFTYRDLAKQLGEDQPIYAFQAKGMDGKGSTLESVSDLADYYIEEIQRIFPNGPFLLGGSSFGGLLAYEMGRKLIESGQTVDLLALFDTIPYNGPFSYGKEGAPAGPKWLGKLDTHIGRLLVRGTKERFQHYSKKGKKLIWNKIPFLSYKESVPPERNQQIWDANFRAIRNYYQEPYNGRLTLFLASDFYARCYQDVRLGWHAYALKGLEIHVVPGDHLTMMYPPNVEVLAAELRKCIDRVIEGG